MSHHKSKFINGLHIEIHQLNHFFEPVTKMLLEHFDVPSHADTLFILSSYCFIPIENFRKVLPGRKIVAFQLEQMLDGNTHVNLENALLNLKFADEIWDYDEMNIGFLKKYHDIQVNRLVPMLYTKSLERPDLDWDNPEFDVIFYGLLNPRRLRIVDQLQRKLYGELKIAWVYGEHEMDKHISNSKVVLNLHPFEPWNRQEQVRMFQPVINGRTVVSEPSQSNNMPGEIIEVPLEEMPERLKQICHTDEWRTFGREAREKFLKRTQGFLLSNNSWFSNEAR